LITAHELRELGLKFERDETFHRRACYFMEQWNAADPGRWPLADIRAARSVFTGPDIRHYASRLADYVEAGCPV
jgi:hypothetical protein